MEFLPTPLQFEGNSVSKITRRKFIPFHSPDVTQSSYASQSSIRKNQSSIPFIQLTLHTFHYLDKEIRYWSTYTNTTTFIPTQLEFLPTLQQFEENPVD
jgi:hypothetical protein